ncbi:conserved hypothetical protein [Pseudoclavibacter sp. 8L]|nr:conserved hypothetical protein [Pseudoclavibacter sp. 8L]
MLPLRFAAEALIRPSRDNGGMTSPRTDLRKRAILAAGQGTLTALYYATPDVISSKAGRGVAKTMLALGVAGLAASEYDELKLGKRGRTEDTDLLVQPAAQAPGELIGGPGDQADAPHPLPGERPQGEDEVDGKPQSFSQFWISLSPASRVALGGLAAAAGIGSILAAVAGERWIYRFGERRAARGVTTAHAKTGLVIGGLTALMALIPPPEDK